MKFIIAKGMAVTALLLTAVSVAGEQLPPVFSSVENRTLIVEKVYPYSVQEYMPIYELTAVTKKNARYDSPEQALRAYFSSMQSGDYSWNQETWTAESSVLNEQRNAQLKKTSEQWVSEWRKFYSGRKIYLKHKIIYSQYVLIDYQTLPLQGSGPATTNTVALVNVGGAWRLTQALASDPILTQWASKRGRVQAIPETFFGK